MEVCSSTEMGALGASHLGTGDHGPKTDRSRPRSVPVNADWTFIVGMFELKSSGAPQLRYRSEWSRSGLLPDSRPFGRKGQNHSHATRFSPSRDLVHRP